MPEVPEVPVRPDPEAPPPDMPEPAPEPPMVEPLPEPEPMPEPDPVPCGPLDEPLPDPPDWAQRLVPARLIATLKTVAIKGLFMMNSPLHEQLQDKGHVAEAGTSDLAGDAGV